MLILVSIESTMISILLLHRRRWLWLESSHNAALSAALVCCCPTSPEDGRDLAQTMRHEQGYNCPLGRTAPDEAR